MVDNSPKVRKQDTHGTYACYSLGKCRCVQCVEVSRAYTREYRERKKLGPIVKKRHTHGTRASYLKGCKCPDCRKAGQDYCRDYEYGLAPGEYEKLKEAQESRCAICGEPPRTPSLHVDHDHDTGEVRGLLCDRCNRGLGQFQDDPDIVEKAALYLRQHSYGTWGTPV